MSSTGAASSGTDSLLENSWIGALEKKRSGLSATVQVEKEQARCSVWHSKRSSQGESVPACQNRTFLMPAKAVRFCPSQSDTQL